MHRTKPDVAIAKRHRHEREGRAGHSFVELDLPEQAPVGAAHHHIEAPARRRDLRRAATVHRHRRRWAILREQPAGAFFVIGECGHAPVVAREMLQRRVEDALGVGAQRDARSEQAEAVRPVALEPRDASER
ncbi:hypothetical protein [Altererythrobacter lauratis]|uniref:Uncharacterized protein n=1 Tax=Alteraurantiacibacter lauratis TaxID=2054627 RepID=A0ABV7EAU4_9SPHN